MGVFHWITENWFELFQTAGIVAGLFFTAHTIRLDTKAKRVGNLMAVTKTHREIWTELYERPGLARVLEPNADLKQSPMTREEDLFLRLLILHLNTMYHASKEGVLLNSEGLPKDIGWFYSLPLPRTTWERMKPLQDVDFVRYVESCLVKK